MLIGSTPVRVRRAFDHTRLTGSIDRMTMRFQPGYTRDLSNSLWDRPLLATTPLSR
jgi:hypothetical protein